MRRIRLAEHEGPRIAALESEAASLRAEVERLRKENRRWARLAGTDGLTGLPNKISFLRAFVPQTFTRASDEGQMVGMILIAADNLGEINEELGREAGDEIIRGLASLVQSLMGDSGRLGHLDGTHFAVMMCPATLETVRARANMLRARVRTYEFGWQDETIQITVSAGVTCVSPEKGRDPQELGEACFQRLGRALYVAKKAGGNRVEVVSEPQASQEDA